MRQHDSDKVNTNDRLLDTDVKDKNRVVGKDSNPDPITKEPGSHPVGTGLGASGGGLAGAAIGTAVGGPIGGIVGGAIGAIGGGLAGHAAGEAIDPTVEDGYWRDNYRTRPYVGADETYETYQPAYKYGWESRNKFQGRKFDEVESDLARGWDKTRGTSSLTWDRAKLATRDAWHRVEDNLPGDADNDGH